jgi:hypothetical protein
MALESTQPLTKMSTRNVPEGKGRRARNADNLSTIGEPIIWDPRHVTNLWAFTACYRDIFIFFIDFSDLNACYSNVLSCFSVL